MSRLQLSTTASRRASGNVSAEAFGVPGPLLIRTRRFGDARGFFTEVYNQRDFAAVGVDETFVQDNQSLSVVPGTLRGMHFQVPPHAQVKLVRVVRGAILDIAVDIRRASPSYGGHVAALLTAAGGEQLYVPAGFGHGFLTLEPDTEVAYKVTHYYAPEQERAFTWDDPALALPWPDLPDGPILSEKDQANPTLQDLAHPF